MREIWFGVMLALALAAGVPASAQAPKPDDAKVAGLLSVSKDDRILGKPDAPITIIEYASLTCPHCAHFENDVLPALEQKWLDTGRAKLIMRDFPLDQVAMHAEVLARCVPPDRYYPLVKTLFQTQDKWVLEKDWRTALQRIALLAGIGPKQFDDCVNNKVLEDEVAGSRLVASQQLGVDATPTFFVNGTKFEGDPSEQAFDQLLSTLSHKS